MIKKTLIDDKNGKKYRYKRLYLYLLILLFILFVSLKMYINTNANNISKTTENTSVIAEDMNIKEKQYEYALNQAQTYSDMMYMSKQSIYEQLTSEYGGQFSDEVAQYAVNNIEVDWNENALKSAKSYLDIMLLPEDAMYDQLSSEYGEKFTKEEAQYAIDNLR